MCNLTACFHVSGKWSHAWRLYPLNFEISIMNLKNKTTLLAAAIALAGVSYLPSASAAIITTTTNLGNIAADDSAIIQPFVASVAGSYENWYDFKVDVISSLIVTGQSLTSSITKGFKLESFNLYEGDHTHKIATGTISSGPLGAGNWYAGLTNYTPLQVNTQYSFEINGQALNKGANYSASLSTISAVPLPGAVWMMLTGMIGLFGYQARNKKTA